MTHLYLWSPCLGISPLASAVPVPQPLKSEAQALLGILLLSVSDRLPLLGPMPSQPFSAHSLCPSARLKIQDVPGTLLWPSSFHQPVLWGYTNPK